MARVAIEEHADGEAIGLVDDAGRDQWLAV
jgi:hypothetical protein